MSLQVVILGAAAIAVLGLIWYRNRGMARAVRVDHPDRGLIGEALAANGDVRRQLFANGRRRDMEREIELEKKCVRE